MWLLTPRELPVEWRFSGVENYDNSTVNLKLYVKPPLSINLVCDLFTNFLILTPSCLYVNREIGLTEITTYVHMYQLSLHQTPMYFMLYLSLHQWSRGFVLHCNLLVCIVHQGSTGTQSTNFYPVPVYFYPSSLKFYQSRSHGLTTVVDRPRDRSSLDPMDNVFQSPTTGTSCM